MEQRTRSDFLDSRTIRHGKQRSIITDNGKALPVTAPDQKKVADFLARFAARQANSDFFRLIDTARRIAGTGSLGSERYILLVEGNGSPDRNYLLDLKLASRSPLAGRFAPLQPHWQNEAERIAWVQRQMQAITPALLHAVELEGHSFIMKELQPSEDKLDLKRWDGKLGRLEELMTTMGSISAWGHLRGSGHRGAAAADELIRFGGDSSWPAPLSALAVECALQTKRQWDDFCEGYDTGVFEIRLDR